jgi:hypothetical protein
MAAASTPLWRDHFCQRRVIGDLNSRFLAVWSGVGDRAFVVYGILGRQPAFALPEGKRSAG